MLMKWLMTSNTALLIEGCDEEQMIPPKDKPKPIKELGGTLKILWSEHCILRTRWNDFSKLGDSRTCISLISVQSPRPTSARSRGCVHVKEWGAELCHQTKAPRMYTHTIMKYWTGNRCCLSISGVETGKEVEEMEVENTLINRNAKLECSLRLLLWCVFFFFFYLLKWEGEVTLFWWKTCQTWYQILRF